MKIAYLHQYFNTPLMSGSTRSFEMARRLVEAGHEVHMITSKRTPDNEARSWVETSEAGIHVHWLPVPYSNHMGFRERLTAFARFALAAGPRARRQNVDLVFATSTPLTIALPAIFASRTKKIPMVFEVRDLWPGVLIAMGALTNPLAKVAAFRLERLAYTNAAHVVALSPGMKQGVVATGYPEDQVTVIPNACDLDAFISGPKKDSPLRSKYDWLGDRPLVVYMGTLGPANGVGFLAKIAAAVREVDPEIRFAAIGTGKDESNVRALATRLGVLDKNFFILDGVPKKAVPSWLSAADMATSLLIDNKDLWHSSPNKFFDALAASRPVAINYQGWLADLLHEYGAGIILDPGDAEASARLIIDRLHDKDWLSAAGTAAQRLARAHFSRDDLANKLITVLETVLESTTQIEEGATEVGDPSS